MSWDPASEVGRGLVRAASYRVVRALPIWVSLLILLFALLTGLGGHR